MVALGFNAFLPFQLGKHTTAPKPQETSASDLLMDDPTGPDQASIEHSTSPEDESLPPIVLDSWRASFNSVMTIFRVPRPTFTVILIFLLYSFTTRVEVLNPQYISITLDWSLATVNSLLAGKALLSAMILFALPAGRTIYLEPRMNDQQVDLFIVKASLILNAIGMVGFGVPIPFPLLIAALLLYTSGNGLYDSLTTFGITSLPVDQKPGDFLVRIGLAQTISGLVAAPFWSTVFSLCLKSDSLSTGLPYWISAGLFGGTIVLSQSLRGQ